MKSNNLLLRRFYIFIFLLSLVGFGYNFAVFLKNSFSINSGKVAGANRVEMPLKVELRVNSKELAEKVLSSLSDNKNVVFTKVTYIKNSYNSDFLIDLTDGSKIDAISNLENILMLGSSKELPSDQLSSDSDVLVIITTK